MICAPLCKCTSNALGRIALSFQMHLKCIRVCCPFILNALQMLSAWSSFALRCTSSACGWSRLHLECIANVSCLVSFCFKVLFKCFRVDCPFQIECISNAFGLVTCCLKARRWPCLGKGGSWALMFLGFDDGMDVGFPSGIIR